MERGIYIKLIMRLWETMDRKTKNAVMGYALEIMPDEDIFSIYTFIKELL